MGHLEARQPGLEETTRAVFERHWRAEGYTCPNTERYPWQWLWDSAFHAIVWAELGDDRAAVETATVLSGQDERTGFVPHIGYHRDPSFLARFWGRTGWSSITQPPMYGHAVAELMARGVPLPDETVERAAQGVLFLLDVRRRSPGGLVELVHPWESGADDSLRWDDLVGGPAITPVERFDRKGALLAAVTRSPEGAPLSNDAFAVGAASMSALVAFNAFEVASITGDDTLRRQAVELAASLSARWEPRLSTWVDDGPTAEGSGRARSSEALLGVLVDPDESHLDAALEQLVDPAAHGAAFGPTGVHRAEPSFAPDTYWRGTAWPQLTYLFFVAARRRGRTARADALRAALVNGAAASGFAEHWHPDTGAAGGAVPQSWTGLAYVAEQS